MKRENGTVRGLNPDTDEVGSSIAHEIGHVMIGYGHPDRPTEAGPAPLDGTDRSLRLMCSHKNRSLDNGKLIVKTEWDEAEIWLRGIPDNRIRDERDLEDHEPTRNY